MQIKVMIAPETNWGEGQEINRRVCSYLPEFGDRKEFRGKVVCKS